MQDDCICSLHVCMLSVSCKNHYCCGASNECGLSPAYCRKDHGCQGECRDLSEAKCGDGLCNGDESVETCPEDCGWPLRGKERGGTVFTCASPGGVHKYYALTFDDGPSKDTERLLDILRKYSVPASFFVLGRNAEKHPHLIRKMHQAGHLVLSHLYTHSHLTNVEVDDLRYEILLAEKAIRRGTCRPPAKYVRVPYGESTSGFLSLVQDMGYR
jgi:hypothetical protein